MDNNNQNRESWGSTFGFLMAAVGSAVGLGNLWGFPYKCGAHGGFAWLLLYFVLVVFTGYILLMTELALGRATGQSIIPAYKKASDGKMTFVGVMSAIAPLLILGFYSYLGGYAMKYAVANLGDIFKAGWGVGGTEGSEFFVSLVGNVPESMIYTVVFMIVTILVVSRGVAAGIESFNKIAMPTLAVLLVIVVIRSLTLPGASGGLEFLFKPDWEVFKGAGLITVLSSAGGQVFFSLSLGMGIMVTYGSYMKKSESIPFNSIIVPIADSCIAMLAGLAIMPAVFSFGMEPGAGPGLLYMTLQNVFNSMGTAGPIFGFIFYILVTLAALTSSISLLEAVISSFVDKDISAGKTDTRKKWAVIFGLLITIEGLLVAYDGLGTNFPLVFGQLVLLDAFDLFSEGILMPLAAMITTIYFGWIKKDFLPNEIKAEGTAFRTEGFYRFCIKFIAPIFCFFILLGQINSFFGLGWF